MNKLSSGLKGKKVQLIPTHVGQNELIHFSRNLFQCQIGQQFISLLCGANGNLLKKYKSEMLLISRVILPTPAFRNRLKLPQPIQHCPLRSLRLGDMKLLNLSNNPKENKEPVASKPCPHLKSSLSRQTGRLGPSSTKFLSTQNSYHVSFSYYVQSTSLETQFPCTRKTAPGLGALLLSEMKITQTLNKTLGNT